MAEAPGTFGDLLRQLRMRGRLTQRELAEEAGLSHRTVSDLERGVASTPQRETARMLADALRLLGQERARFESAARGETPGELPQPAAAAALRSLPRDVGAFTGRGQQLEQLGKSTATASARTVVGIQAIGGMAGVGKTAFAVHAAHRLAGQFPGGQIFLPLHGHTPGQLPVEPADALASLLVTIGVPAARIPPGLEERTALWRDQAAGRRLLLVLDDAASSQQVEPLLPGTGGSLVLVTSRRQLTALDDATAISLDTLPPDEAAALLARLSGRTGLRPGDTGVADIVRLCGYLPLAIGMMARQLRHHPAWTAAGRAAELAAARDRLGLMETENLSVAAAFDLSYANLTGGQQQLFRRLGLHPGAGIDAYAAAALDGTGVSSARHLLGQLHDEYLLTEPAQGRYQLHDLVREHARALAGRLDDPGDRNAAAGRLLGYYARTAAVADARISRRTRPGRTAGHDDGEPGSRPALADTAQALGWVRTERGNLLSCLDQATRAGDDDRVVALIAGISGLLVHDGPWSDAIAWHSAAMRAAQRRGDRLGYANALHDLGNLRALTDDYPAAARAHEEALAIYQELGEKLGQANARAALGDVRYLTGEYPAAVRALEEAIETYHELGGQQGEAIALNRLGATWQLTGDYRAAAAALERALALYRALGDRRGQAYVLSGLGAVRRQTGDLASAQRDLDEALRLYRDLDDRLGLGNTLSYLGAVLRLAADYPAALRAVDEALELFRALGNRRGLANALNYRGSVYRLTGREAEAAADLEEALALYRAIGDRGGEVEVLNERGALHLRRRELSLAERCHRQSLELSRAIDSPPDEGQALAGLGRCASAAGDPGQAGLLLRQALEIAQRIGAADVPTLRAELEGLAQ